MAKSAKTRAKKAAKKRPAKKAAAKKVAAKRPAGRAAMMMSAGGAGGLGCCVVTNLDGPDQEFPNYTKAQCKQKAKDLKGICHWYSGDCE